MRRRFPFGNVGPGSAHDAHGFGLFQLCPARRKISRIVRLDPCGRCAGNGTEAPERAVSRGTRAYLFLPVASGSRIVHAFVCNRLQSRRRGSAVSCRIRLAFDEGGKISTVIADKPLSYFAIARATFARPAPRSPGESSAGLRGAKGLSDCIAKNSR